ERHAREWIARSGEAALPSLLITVPEEAGRIIGGCGLHAKGGHHEVGYWVSPAQWGRGYATEAVSGLVSLARSLGHRRLIGRHAVDNPASGRVLRKAGFRPTGRAGVFDSLARGATLEASEYVLDFDGVEPMKRRWMRPEAYSAGALAA